MVNNWISYQWPTHHNVCSVCVCVCVCVSVSVSSLDDMLRAGINKASHLVVVNRESHENMTGEETLADSETIIAVQTVFRYMQSVLLPVTVLV